MKSRICIGIDIGLDGGIAVIEEGDLTFYCKSKRTKDGVDVPAMAKILSPYADDTKYSTFLAMEDLHAILGASAAASFSFGFNNGVIVTMVEMLKIPYVKVAPKRWQKMMWMGIRPVEISTLKKTSNGLPRRKIDTKATSLLAARRLFPKEEFLDTPRCKVAHDGIVDAVLLAEYAFRIKHGVRD